MRITETIMREETEYVEHLVEKRICDKCGKEETIINEERLRNGVRIDRCECCGRDLCEECGKFTDEDGYYVSIRSVFHSSDDDYHCELLRFYRACKECRDIFESEFKERFEEIGRNVLAIQEAFTDRIKSLKK